MGKWISRCVEKSIELHPEGNTGGVDFLAGELEHDSKGSIGHPPILDHLTEAEREAYQSWYDVMVGPKFNISHEEAHSEAMKLLIKTSRLLRIDQAAQDYKRDGYLKIFSTRLNRPVYLARNENVKRRVPDKTLQVFMESEIQTLKGLSPDELMLMLEAKAMFNFNGVIEDGEPNEK